MTDSDIKPRRVIMYCVQCRWAGDVTDSPIIKVRCPQCSELGLSYVAFHEHEIPLANNVLLNDISKSVDDVGSYETT